MKKIHINKNGMIVIILMFIGLVIRTACCFWAFPYHLHSDEFAIVDSAIEMISRRSFEPNIYNRPDHFEIKCCALLFTILSRLKYHVSADIAFEAHTAAFYTAARFFTTVCGTLMIPMAYLLAEKVKRHTGLIAAGMFTIYQIFVIHSGYATPDIPLSLFVMLHMYTAGRYIEKPDKKTLYLLCIEIAIAITIKYTAAISCILIAILIIVDAVKKKEYGRIIKEGLLSILVILGVCFLLAPNLFTNIEATIETLQLEAESSHLGADGLGLFGNLGYYITYFISTTGYEFTIFVLIGLACLLRKKERYQTLPICLGGIYWVCTSVLSLHWSRWGMPMYITFLLLGAIGIRYFLEKMLKIKSRIENREKIIYYRICYLAGILIIMIVGANMLLDSINVTMRRLSMETRVAGKEYCEEHGITEENTIYEGASPLKLAGPKDLEIVRDQNGKLIFPQDYKDAKYIILSSIMYARYYAESEKYAEQVAIYETIKQNYDMIYEIVGVPEQHHNVGVRNIYDNIVNIREIAKNGIVGCTIQIYKVDQEEKQFNENNA